MKRWTLLALVVGRHFEVIFTATSLSPVSGTFALVETDVFGKAIDTIAAVFMSETAKATNPVAADLVDEILVQLTNALITYTGFVPETPPPPPVPTYGQQMLDALSKTVVVYDKQNKPTIERWV